MEITWLGHSCFRIKGKEALVLTDPYDPSLGYSLGKVNATIVTSSHPHPGHSYCQGVEGNPKILCAPGEYEICNVLLEGIATYHDNDRGKERGKNTVYVIEVDDVKLCHLGDLGHVPSAGQVEAMGDVEVLFLPVGGLSTINAPQAAETVRLLEPKLVIPMHYKTEAVSWALEPVQRFLREMGIKEATPQPKLSVTRSSLPPTTQVVVLSYGGKA